ncbi:MAG: TonB-dependent receptor [Acidobacteria bacterium]|nr:TonB-dependent receptor [Acidobacteriota bacterium]
MNKKFSQTISGICTAMILTFCFSGIISAQEITGSIIGTVRDSAGAPVAGATVTISDPSKNDIVIRSATTNDSGEFSAPSLPISTYIVTVEATNFKKSINTDVKVDVGQRRTVDVQLEAGNISETVTVESDQVAVELSTPTAGTIISGDQVRELSLNNRNFVQLVALAPGVSSDLADQVYVGTTNPDGQANTINLSVNGARSSQNTFTVDGADVTDRGSNITIQAYPSVDSIGEFRILRSLYPAESGRSGGGQVNVVTRSGTDRFSGTLYEFIRNEAFNANDYFTNQTRSAGIDENGKAKRRPFRYNNYGWTLGGPIYFLRFGEANPDESYFKRYDRTFFFFSQEFRKDLRYPTLVSTVPSAGLRQGVFTAPICLQVTAGVCSEVLPTGTPLTNVRPINPVAQQYLTNIYNKLPLPNSATGFGLNFPTFSESKFRQEIFKLDHSFSDKWSAYYRFQNDKIPTEDANSLFSSGSGLPGVSTTRTNSPGRTHTFQSTYALNQNMIVEGRYTYGYGAILSENVGLLALSNSPIAPPLPYAVQRDRVPTISGNGFSALQGFGPYDNFSNKQNFSGSFTWIAGSHTMKFGAIYSLYRKNENALAGSNEGLFSGFNTPGGTAATIAPGGNTVQQQWANFLLGTNVSFSQASFDYTADLRQKTFEWFAQDEWRIRPNLTLYYGLRYSFFGSPWDKNGRLTNFVPELFNQAAAPLVTGAGNRVVAAGKNFCNGIIANSQNYTTGPANFNCTPIESPYGKFVVDAPKMDFAPRIGLAWDPFGNGRTSIRTGYGIYHDQVLNGTLLQQIGLNPPYQQTCTVSGVRLDNPVPGGNCSVASSALAPNLRGLQADWKTPYMQHWSLDWQQQLTADTIITVGYYGSKGTNLIGAFELNELAPGTALNSQCAVGASTIPTVRCQEPGTAFFSAAATRILDQIRPYRGYQSLTLIQPRFGSNYHSLQLSAKHRFSRGSEVNFAYTWSKNLTNNQTDRSTAPQNSYDIQSEYGRATLDRRHIFTANYVYELPFYSEQRGFVGKILGGWQASGIVTYNTGLPFTVTTSAYDPAGLGFIPALVAGGRPNVLCNPNENAPHTQQQWFNTSCFEPNPAAGATGLSNKPGSAPRGVINGPNTFRTDLTLAKNIRFTENLRLQLRAESYNVFNTTNFRTISTNITATNFGQVTATRDPRTFQFAVKFYF